MKLLSINSDHKTVKGLKKGWLTGIMYLAPHTLGGFGTVCPKSTPGCRDSCLFTAGHGTYDRVRQARIARTALLRTDPDVFKLQLSEELTALEKRAKRMGLKPCARLNGTSDLPWLGKYFAPRFPGIMFYDYTKIPRPWERELPNYKITFSRSERNTCDCRAAIDNGINVAVVHGGYAPGAISIGLYSQPLKFIFTINGDENDLRFLDKRPRIILLKPKGRARKDQTGFVVR